MSEREREIDLDSDPYDYALGVRNAAIKKLKRELVTEIRRLREDQEVHDQGMRDLHSLYAQRRDQATRYREALEVVSGFVLNVEGNSMPCNEAIERIKNAVNRALRSAVSEREQVAKIREKEEEKVWPGDPYARDKEKSEAIRFLLALLAERQEPGVERDREYVLKLCRSFLSQHQGDDEACDLIVEIDAILAAPEADHE